MDSENPTGSPNEFLGMLSDADDTAPPDDQPTEDASLATAADDSAEEESYEDLSPEERVAAELGLEDDDDGIEYPDLGDETPDEDDLAATAAGAIDLDALTPEQLRALAEEALTLREQQAQSGVEAVNREIDVAYQSIVGELQQTLSASEQHYRAEKRKRLVAARADAENQPDPDAWFARKADEIDATVSRAQKAWEAEQVAQHEARFQGVRQEKLRPQYAAWLAEQRNLPLKAIEKILQEPNVDRMAERADELAAYRDALLAERRKNTQQVREGRGQGRRRAQDRRSRHRPPPVAEAHPHPGRGRRVPLLSQSHQVARHQEIRSWPFSVR